MNEDFIQIKEAAEILGVSKLTLRNWDKSGKLVAYRHPINNYRVYKSEDIHNIIKKIQPVENSEKMKKTGSTIPKQKVYNLRDLLQKN